MIVGEAGKLVSKLTYVCSHSQLMIVGEAGKLVSRAYICLFIKETSPNFGKGQSTREFKLSVHASKGSSYSCRPVLLFY